MKKYEFTCLISLEPGKVQEEIESFIVENEGELLSRKIDPAKREFGYKIKGKKEGYLASFVFTIDPLQAIELGKRMSEKEEVIRHILISKEDFKKESLGPKEKNLEMRESKKIELKDIDKKIEEILSE